MRFLHSIPFLQLGGLFKDLQEFLPLHGFVLQKELSGKVKLRAVGCEDLFAFFIGTVNDGVDLFVDGRSNISLLAKDGTVWLNQNQMAELFDTSKQNISLHINNILKDNELQENSVVKEYLTTAADGKNYSVACQGCVERSLTLGNRLVLMTS